jgi:hypothetical protein
MNMKKEGIIEKHYGLKGPTAEEVSENLGVMAEALYRSGVKMSDILKDRNEILIHRGNIEPSDENSPMLKGTLQFICGKQDDHTLDTANYLAQGSPHLPFEKPAVKSAEDVHLNLMQSEFINNIFKGHSIVYQGGLASGRSYLKKLLKDFGFK